MTLEVVVDLTHAQRERELDEDLAVRACRGDELALAALLRRYRGFVRAKARTYFLVGGDREDVVQEGLIGLYKAIRDFDPARQTSFRGFAELCVTRQIITAVKTATRQKHGPLNSYVSLYMPTHGDDSDAELLDSFVSDLDDPCDSLVSRQELADLQRWCADILSELESQVLRRYVAGESYVEIAGALRRHVKSIDNALQRIKRKLDAHLQQRALDLAV